MSTWPAPFTLVAPALGFISGALTAVGAAPREPWSPALLTAPFVGAAMAALLNAGNNALNQIYDLDIDRVNKPKRPLPSGRLTTRQTWVFTAITYALALVLAWLVAPGGRHECFWLVAIAVVCTFLYSVPPFRTKRLGIWANVTIAIPRGVLLKVAGWSSVKTIVGVEPWYHRQRIALLEAVAKRYGLKLWGNLSQSLPASSPLHRCFQGEVWGADMYQVLRRSRITLNSHIDLVGNEAGNVRLFESTGVGTFLLTDFKDNLHTLFEPEREVAVWHSIDDCLAKIERYLRDDSGRAAISGAGQAKTISTHNYRNRAQEILRLAAGL